MNYSKPVVSFIIPVYNEEKYLRQCLESIINLMDTSFEICISDNCSTDQTWDIILAFAQKYSCIKVTRTDYGVHMFDNFHSALRLATGRYFVHVGGDDYISKNYITDAIMLLERDPSLSFVVPRIDAFSDRLKTKLRSYPLGNFEPEFTQGISEPVSYFLNNVHLEYLIVGGVFKADLLKTAVVMSNSTCEATASWYMLYVMLKSPFRPIKIGFTSTTAYMKRYDKETSCLQSVSPKTKSIILVAKHFLQPTVWRLKRIIGSVRNTIFLRQLNLINNKDFFRLLFSDRHQKTLIPSFVMKAPIFGLIAILRLQSFRKGFRA